MKKNIGLLSDLHLEASNLRLENPGWDYLVIAGDLSAYNGNLDNFFAYNIPQDIPVIYVPGNHEYEGKRFDTVKEKLLEQLAPYSNVHLLINDSVVIDNIKFIGSTLWTDFAIQGDVKAGKDWAKFHVSDFSTILYPNEQGKYVPISPDVMEKLHVEAREYLHQELLLPFDGEKVVVTHFAPHINSVHPSYLNKNYNYWATDCTQLMGHSQYWFHGHIHDSSDYTVNGTRVVCNPRGNSKTFDLASNMNFDRNLLLPIELQLTNKNKMRM